MACCDGEWWLADNGENYLKGDPCDCDNPVRLPDEWILEFLRDIPAARDSFNRVFWTLLPGEQARLRDLIAGFSLDPDPKDVEDTFQRTLNVQGIHTVGPYGGAGYG